MDLHLCGGMLGDVDVVEVLQESEVLNDDRISTDVPQEPDERNGLLHLGVLDQGVDGHMDLDPVVMGVSHSTLELAVAEVAREGARSETLPRQIDGIASALHGGGKTVG